MPRFERAKGKFHCEINQSGNALSVREWIGNDQRLTGYCMFPDNATASREFERLLRTKSAEGFLPADAAARELAAALKLEGPKPKVAPTLPLCQDLHVYNEATGFTVGALKLAGKGMEDADRKWNKAVNDGLLMPITLYQDDPFCIRVVAGDKLNAQEAEEWVGRLEWRLKLDKSQLSIAGGAEWLYQGYDPGDVDADNFVRIVELPPGHYRATLYSYLSGVNGEACLDELAGGHGKSEPIGQWFRRTRPGEPFPDWMVNWCVAYPDSDPGHEKEWQSTALPDRQSAPEFVDFLLHLEPADPPAKPAKARTTGGWFSHTEGARKPERCPMGLFAKDVIGHEKRAEGKWFWPCEIFPRVEGHNPTPLVGGEVAVPLDQLGDVYRLARFCHRNLAPELRVTLPPGTGFSLEGKWPENFLALRDDQGLRFAVPPEASDSATLQAAAARLRVLPNGARLELATAVLGQFPLTGERPIGTHRYRGTVLNGVWHIDHTFPAADAETLRAALALSDEARAGHGFKLRNDDEAVKIQQWCKSNLGRLIADDPPVHEGEFLRLKEPKAAGYIVLAGAVFAVRYQHVWPVFEFADGPAKPRRVMPPQGERVLEIPGGRIYCLSDARVLGEPVQAGIEKLEKELSALGFRFAADIVCNLFVHVVVRGYASPKGDTWASVVCAWPNTVKLEISSRFAKEQASLLTSTELKLEDDPAKCSFMQGAPFTTIEELLSKHQSRLTQLAAKYGPCILIEPTPLSLAESIEAALAKKLGG